MNVLVLAVELKIVGVFLSDELGKVEPQPDEGSEVL